MRPCPSFLHRGQSIGRFTGLADSDDHGISANNRISITELGCVVDFDRNLRKRLNHKFSDMRRMQRSPHRDDVKTFYSCERVQVAEIGFEANPA